MEPYTCVDDLPIGVGAQGKTFLVQKDNIKYILKVQSQSTLSNNEVRILKLLKNKEYVVQLHKVKKKNSKLYTIITYGSKGTLDSFLNKSKYLSNMENVIIFMKKLMIGLKNLHQKGYVHADLKPENIVVDENYNPLLIDFDMSVPIRKKAMPRGTLSFMAPEVMQAFSYQKEVLFTPEVDLYSVGLIFYLITKRRPAVILPKLNYNVLLKEKIEFDAGDAKHFYDFIFDTVKTKSSRIDFYSALYKLNSNSNILGEDILTRNKFYRLKDYANEEELQNLEGYKTRTLIYGGLFFLVLLFTLALIIRIIKNKFKYHEKEVETEDLIRESIQSGMARSSDY
jgi:serine/threonine protein kinase